MVDFPKRREVRIVHQLDSLLSINGNRNMKNRLIAVIFMNTAKKPLFLNAKEMQYLIKL
jgi:hypothetical protein